MKRSSRPSTLYRGIFCSLFLSLCLLRLPPGTPAAASSLLLDAATAITWGDITVADVTAKASSGFFNPGIAAEYRFGESERVALGIGYARSENDFHGEWEGSDGRHTVGEITIERRTLDLYARLIAGPNFNLRIGYRDFRYEFTDGYLRKEQNGMVIEIAEDAVAAGDLTKGFDAELNFCGGRDLQLRFALGYTYFFDAEYNWAYDRTRFPAQHFDRNLGDAVHDAMSVRLKPELTYRLQDDFRLTLDYTLGVSIWESDTDQADIEDFAGVEIYSAFGIGIECLLAI